MDTLNLPETLTIEQLKKLKKLISSSENKKTMTKATLRKYHLSEKGRKKRSEAQMRYYWKKKAEKQQNKQEELKKQIDKAELELQSLKDQLILID